VQGVDEERRLSLNNQAVQSVFAIVFFDYVNCF
jgi:hypothetical protein